MSGYGNATELIAFIEVYREAVLCDLVLVPVRKHVRHCAEMVISASNHYAPRDSTKGVLFQAYCFGSLDRVPTAHAAWRAHIVKEIGCLVDSCRDE